MTSRSFLSFFFSRFPSLSAGSQTKGSASCSSWLCHPGREGWPRPAWGPCAARGQLCFGSLEEIRSTGSRVGWGSVSGHLAWSRFTEYSELEGTHRDHPVQLSSEWPVWGCFSCGTRRGWEGIPALPQPLVSRAGRRGVIWDGDGADVPPIGLPARSLIGFCVLCPVQ